MMTRYEARNILAACGVPLGANFHVLPAATVDLLLGHADARRYRKPRNANGSRGRYWHAYLQRRATLYWAEFPGAVAAG